jgi:hypothetical protein
MKPKLITLASSTIIETINHQRKSGEASLAFFYCDFRHDQKKHRRGLLSSLLLQLCDQSIDCAEILQRFYSDHGLEEPSESALTQCLKNILRCAGNHPIYIILDALDECPKAVDTPSPREKVLELVEELVGCQLPNLRICVTSRPEIDIETALDLLESNSVSLRVVSLQDEQEHGQDIAEYIKSAVRKMGNLNEQNKELVIQTLSRKANGM